MVMDVRREDKLADGNVEIVRLLADEHQTINENAAGRLSWLAMFAPDPVPEPGPDEPPPPEPLPEPEPNT